MMIKENRDMFNGLVVESIAEKIIARPDMPISLLLCLLIISILFYLLVKNNTRNEKVLIELEGANTLLGTIIEIVKIDHETTKTNRDNIQDLAIGQASNTALINGVFTQIGNLFSELHSHRDECNRKIIGK